MCLSQRDRHVACARRHAASVRASSALCCQSVHRSRSSSVHFRVRAARRGGAVAGRSSAARSAARPRRCRRRRRRRERRRSSVWPARARRPAIAGRRRRQPLRRRSATWPATTARDRGRGSSPTLARRGTSCAADAPSRGGRRPRRHRPIASAASSGGWGGRGGPTRRRRRRARARRDHGSASTTFGCATPPTAWRGAPSSARAPGQRPPATPPPLRP